MASMSDGWTPNKVAAWAAVALLGAVAQSWLATWTQDIWWRYALAVGLALLIVLTAPGGFLSASGPFGRTLSVVLLLAFVGLSPVLLSTQEFLPNFALVTLLWGAVSAVGWRSWRSNQDLNDVLFGVAGMPLGAAALLGGDTLVGVAILLFGVAFLLGGVAALLFGVRSLLGGDTLFGVAFLLVGVAALLLGVGSLLGGDALGGVALLLGGLAFLLVGVAALRHSPPDRSVHVARLRSWIAAKDDPESTTQHGKPVDAPPTQ